MALELRQCQVEGAGVLVSVALGFQSFLRGTDLNGEGMQCCVLLFFKVFHTVAPNRGAVFLQNPTMQCGADFMFLIFIRCGAVR